MLATLPEPLRTARRHLGAVRWMDDLGLTTIHRTDGHTVGITTAHGRHMNAHTPSLLLADAVDLPDFTPRPPNPRHLTWPAAVQLCDAVAALCGFSEDFTSDTLYSRLPGDADVLRRAIRDRELAALVARVRAAAALMPVTVTVLEDGQGGTALIDPPQLEPLVSELDCQALLTDRHSCTVTITKTGIIHHAR